MLRVIEACTKSGGATHSCSDARQAQRAGIVRWRVGPDGERGEAGEAGGREGGDGVQHCRASSAGDVRGFHPPQVRPEKRGQVVAAPRAPAGTYVRLDRARLVLNE